MGQPEGIVLIVTVFENNVSKNNNFININSQFNVRGLEFDLGSGAYHENFTVRNSYLSFCKDFL